MQITRRTAREPALAAPTSDSTSSRSPALEPSSTSRKKGSIEAPGFGRRCLSALTYGLLLGTGGAAGSRPVPSPPSNPPSNPQCLKRVYDYEKSQLSVVSSYEYHPNLWNYDYLRYTHFDAYQYAIDVADPYRHLHLTRNGMRHPVHRFANCSELHEAAVDEGLKPVPHCDRTPPPGKLLVAGYVGHTIYGSEAHWLRSHPARDNPNYENSFWSGKRNSWPATNVDVDGNTITDLSKANFDYLSDPAVWNGVNYTDFCGCYHANC